MKKIPSIQDFSLKDQTVLVRVDYNVPMKDGKIQDDTRIEETLKTLNFLIQQNCKIVLISHLGNPNGKKDLSLSLKPVATYLENKLKKPVVFVDNCLDTSLPKKIQDSAEGTIFLLENLRFHIGEEDPKKDPSFAKTLSTYADFFVDDAFGCAHRKHSSIYEICKLFPNRCMVGLLIIKEIESLQQLQSGSKKPTLAILGGAKVESKIKVIESLLEKVDALALGGGMAIPFINAKSFNFFSEISTTDSIDLAKNIFEIAKKKNKPIFLPLDFAVSDLSDTIHLFRYVDTPDGCNQPETPVDIGPKTVTFFKSLINHYQTIFWNGPLGIFEIEPFSIGTMEIAKALALSKKITIVGGGDSVAAIEKAKLKNKFSHVSTGGGASIEFIENGTLPGIDAIIDANS